MNPIPPLYRCPAAPFPTRAALPMAIAILLACAWPNHARADGEAPASVAAPRQTQDPSLTPELMYRLLVADIALQRGQPALAARAYYEAAKDARNPVFARRATEIALATRQQAIALQSARLWSDLDPASERAKQIASSVVSEGVDSAATDLQGAPTIKSQLEQILAEAAQKGPALGQA